ncbi:Uncharacterised protein [Serratia quinivorans]|uniref:hypothetical protein n=1 Tax=Serratia quinivorans TaxID=137545 RepID=UPI002176FC78|nr:hypothetical protein [Serratia quinivorans]CAI0905583.1 Uncharacterised protein [Serratia quinivorans]
MNESEKTARQIPTEEEKRQLRELLENKPNFVFQQLNKRMNQDGLMLRIVELPRENAINGISGTSRLI